MSNVYSIGGYQIALQARSSKTLLVEGKDDKDLFQSLSQAGSNTRNIDTAEIFRDQAVSGLGAKAKIDHLLSVIPSGSPVHDKLVCIVDREWEELVDINTNDTIPWSSPIVSSIRLKTSGHSIENHSFSDDFSSEYLRHFGNGVATVGVIDSIRAAFPHLVQLAAAFSESVRKRQLITRCTGLVELGDIAWDGTSVSLSQSVEDRLVSRNCPHAQGMKSEIERLVADKWSHSPLAAEAHWHVHGHIGEEIIWSGIGYIVKQNGFPESVAQEVGFGRRNEKRRVWHRWLASKGPQLLAPLDRALA